MPSPAPAPPVDNTADTGRSGAAILSGVADMVPLVFAYLPFALVIGAAVAAHGDTVAGWAGSWLIYGGSAHLAAIQALDDGGATVAIVTGLLINARLIVYSAGLARRWRGQPRWFRIAAAGLIIDPTWAAAERYADGCADARRQRGHFIAAGLALGVGWSAAIGAGAIVGARLARFDLDIVVPLCLLALVGEALRERDSRRVIIAAALVAWITSAWPSGTGTLAAITAGVAAGRLGRRRPT